MGLQLGGTGCSPGPSGQSGSLDLYVAFGNAVAFKGTGRSGQRGSLRLYFVVGLQMSLCGHDPKTGLSTRLRLGSFHL